MGWFSISPFSFIMKTSKNETFSGNRRKYSQEARKGGER
ncbi:hypothetical protein B4135_1225 [Caldibacillus debilis]|uniref:Uncharacterized protein n=1 Tax=Caldibacillus debilis TaxID=301148 RepID=A0A150MDP7_9BACI|nr:hypothetical protein B4135_1225 [Caldibacillus debilis]